MDALRRIAGLVFRPQREWERIAAEEASVDILIRHYVVPLALLGPIATTIGMRWFDRAWDADRGYRVPAGEIFAAAATTFFTSIFLVFALAAIFVLIAPMYGSTRNYRRAFTVATYGAVPVLLAGATLVLPVMAIVSVVAFLHTLYLYWLGAKRVLQVTRNEQAEFVGISMLLSSMVATLFGAIVGSLGVF